MTTLFTRIIDGELPGRFVHTDERCVAFLTIAPLQPGHTLVVPRDEVDHWIDLDPDVTAHLMRVAQRIGLAQQRAFSPARVGLIIAGMEVPHTHLHVVPIRTEADLDFAHADHARRSTRRPRRSAPRSPTSAEPPSRTTQLARRIGPARSDPHADPQARSGPRSSGSGFSPDGAGSPRAVVPPRRSRPGRGVGAPSARRRPATPARR